MTERQIPSFTEAIYKPKSSRYVVCLFVINEGERVRRQLKKMVPLTGQVDIVVADGGSTDGSLDPAYMNEVGVRAVLTKTGPGKLSAQMRMAMAWALDQGYDAIITVDGNDKDDTSAVPLFVAALDEGYDHLQGSRYIPGGKAINTPLSRHVGVMILHAPVISLSAGFRYTDTTNGFRAYSRKFLEDARVQPFRDVFEKYELHYYLAIQAARLGFKVKEIPVTRAYPKGEPTPTKISPLKGNALIIKTLFKAAFRQYDPQG
jgi:dolichol-phosphate mannosyltransferase